MRFKTDTLIPHPVPTGLVAATVDFLLITRPASHQVPRDVADLAIRLGYGRLTAADLAERVTAAALMFNHPHWRFIKAITQNLAPDGQIVSAHIVQRFIATAPLSTQHSFNIHDLARSLTSALPACGNA